jgi:hypothetical protein
MVVVIPSPPTPAARGCVLAPPAALAPPPAPPKVFVPELRAPPLNP